MKKHPFCGAFLVFWGFKFLSIKRILKTKEALDNIRNFIDKQQLTNSDTPKKSTVPNEDKKGIR
ncbi:hypothetical protein COD28_09070 [Escherichia coli]|nr:hypothetical protein COD28_09070 [Escherichia coli]